MFSNQTKVAGVVLNKRYTEWFYIQAIFLAYHSLCFHKPLSQNELPVFCSTFMPQTPRM